MSADEWAIRTVSRDAIVEHMLVRHFGHSYGGISRESALADVNCALDRWIGNGLGVAISEQGRQQFDPAEVLNFAISSGLERGDPFWEEHIVASARARTLLQHGQDPASAEAPDPSRLSSAELNVRIDRTYNCARAAGGSTMRLSLPVPVETHEVSDLHLSGGGVDTGDATLDGDTLTARLASDYRGQVEIGAEMQIRQNPLARERVGLSDKERALYLKPNEGLIRIDAEIEALAEQASAGIGDKFEKARSIFDFIVNRFRFGSIPYHAIDPERPAGWSMKAGFVDCQIGAALFCAMCRSAGIPARMVSGYLMYRHEQALHYWADAWVEDRGWVPFDLIVWLISCGGRDHQWRTRFTGVVDYRFTTEILPLRFARTSSVRLPRAWHMLTRREDDCYESSFIDAYDGDLIYRDRIRLI